MVSDMALASTSPIYKWFFVLMALLLGGIFYYQYQFYRTPVEAVETTVIADGEIIETDGVRHSIPLDDIITGNPHKDGIPSIDEPVYESVGAADQYLDNDGYGLVVEAGGEERFYPYQILVWHEIVNDTFNGEALAVTYCPLCFTGVVFERMIAETVVEFGTSGKLYNSNLLMYDRKTESLWSQAMGEAVVGDLTGARLKLYPSLTISWTEFKQNYPGGEVLSRQTGHTRDYTSDPYGPRGYYEDASVWFPLSNEDARAHPKTVIYGYRSATAQKAYALDAVEQKVLINDQVGEEAVLIFWDSDLSTVRGFSRQLDGVMLEFEQTDEFFKDVATGSLWNTQGEAVSGDYRGRRLESLILKNSFWFSWATTYPQTDLLLSE